MNTTTHTSVGSWYLLLFGLHNDGRVKLMEERSCHEEGLHELKLGMCSICCLVSGLLKSSIFFSIFHIYVIGHVSHLTILIVLVCCMLVYCMDL